MSGFSKRVAGVLVLGLLGCAVLAWFTVFHAGRRAAPEALREASDSPLALAERTTIGAVALRASPPPAPLAGLQEQPGAPAVAPPASRPGQGAAEPEGPAPDQGRLVQVRYDGIFDVQALDFTWAQSERKVLADFFSASALPGVRVDELDCRESMCRARLHVEGDLARRGFVARLGSPPFDHGTFFHADAETGQLTVFSARQGRQLPGLDPDEKLAP